MKTLAFLSMLALLLLVAYNAQAQFLIVTGTVIDYVSGKTISQLSIIEKNSGIGTITSDNGGFSLALKRGEVELTFSDENYKPSAMSFILRNDTTVHVLLEASVPDEGKKARKETAFLPARNKQVAIKGNEKK